jgi:hypothetical protein
MKRKMMNCARWQLRWRRRLISVPAAMLCFVLSAQAQDRMIPPIGGPGGGEFVARCPPGQFLGGVELRVGDDIDAIQPLLSDEACRQFDEAVVSWAPIGADAT